MRGFVAGDGALVFPPGTVVAHMAPSWGMYVNYALRVTWVAYSVPKGTQITKLPGIRSKMDRDFAGLYAFVESKQAQACGECGD